MKSCICFNALIPFTKRCAIFNEMGFNCSEARHNLLDDGVQNYTNYFVKFDILYPSFC